MDEAEIEYSTSFFGPCTCPEDCPHYGQPEDHGWLGCGGELPGGSDCPCEAGWEE